MSPRIIQHRRYQNHGVTSPNGTPISVKQKLRRSPTGVAGKFFRLPNRVVIVGLFLRRANGVRPYTYIELIPQVE